MKRSTNSMASLYYLRHRRSTIMALSFGCHLRSRTLAPSRPKRILINSYYNTRRIRRYSIKRQQSRQRQIYSRRGVTRG